MSDHALFGWRVRSELTLTLLQPWQGDDRAPDITITLGSVPPVDPRLPLFSPAVQITPTGVRVHIPGVAGYWVEAGQRVTVQPVLPEDAPDICVFLLGTILGILCFQRGVLPLHASAVEIGGKALLLSGNSGAGKSTLAAAISARGHRLLSDDLCALEVRDGQPPKLHPAFPCLKLWRDSAEQLQVAVEGLERSREELEKYHIPIAAPRFRPEVLPPAQIIFLRTATMLETPRPRILSGLEALRRYELVYRWRLGLAMGLQAPMFQAMARLIETTPAAELPRSEEFADLPALVDAVLALVDAPNP